MLRYFFLKSHSRAGGNPGCRANRFAALDSRLRGNDEKAEIEETGEEGFSLMELMVVLVILGLLATVVVINVLPAADQANVTKVRADISTLESAVEQYRLDNMSYPPTLQALVAAPPDLTQPQRYRSGGYIRRLPNDPWGNPYQFAAPGAQSGGAYDIFTYGADGQPGGEEENADIGNWQ